MLREGTFVSYKVIMNKDKVLNLVSKNYKTIHFFTGIFNNINIKNKTRRKGVKVNVGVSYLNGLKIISHGSNNKVIIGDYVQVYNSKIIISGDNNSVVINDFDFIDNVEFCLEDSDNQIVIGKHTYIHKGTQLSAIEGTRICIGSNCLFSSDISFRTGDSHSILNLKGDRLNKSQDIEIESHVWIGMRALCLKGVHVSKNSVVAAATILNKKYEEENVIIAGTPGKIVKKEINWKTER